MNAALHRLDIIDEHSSREVGRVSIGGCCFPMRREGIGDSDEDEEEVQMGGVRPRETRNVQRQPREARGNVLDEVTKQLKIEVSDFVGKLDLPEDRKVRFVKFKLKGSARVWWSSIEERLRRTLQAPIIKWEDMKEKLETKYLPITYEQLVYEDMLLWSQGTKLLVDQYTERFQELTVRKGKSIGTRLEVNKYLPHSCCLWKQNLKCYNR
ncbi:hypothetical protein ACOSQ3_021270 [Xanthoceras sorbifolium]